ncbi:MAG: hypothetical protein V3V05_02970 [Pontiella sp.]
MSLSDLTKDQKKYIGIGLVGAIIIAVLAVVGIQFSLSSIATAKLELADLTLKIENADVALAKQAAAREEYDHTVTQLKEYFAGVPPEKNYYSWATEVIYATGRISELEIESIDEVANYEKDKSEEAEIKFESYSLRITAHGSYEQVKLFLQNIEETHSLVRITGLEIGVGSKLSSHNVQVFIQWPFNLDEITAVWDDIESKQRKIAIREVTKPAPERNKVPTGKEPDEQVTKLAAGSVEPAPVSKPDPQPSPVPDVVPPVPVVSVVVAEPEPFVRLKPIPEPAIVKPEPVVATVVPDPEPFVKPKPVSAVKHPVSLLERIEDTKPDTEVNTSETRTAIILPEEPEPVVTVVVPEPEPPVVKSMPEALLASLVVPATEYETTVTNSLETVVAPEEPAPVIAASVISEPKPVVEPVREVESIDSLLSSYAHLETGTDAKKAEPQTNRITTVEIVPEPAEPKDEFGSLLASLGSHSDEPQAPASTDTASSDPDELEAFLKQMSEPEPPSEAKPVEKSEKVDPVILKPVIQPAGGETAPYVSSAKSAKILQELLSKEEPKAGASLSSFLDSLVEDINE